MFHIAPRFGNTAIKHLILTSRAKTFHHENMKVRKHEKKQLIFALYLFRVFVIDFIFAIKTQNSQLRN